MAIAFCDGCGASLTEQARYCGNCGKQTRLGRKTHRAKTRATHTHTKAAAAAITLLFVGPLLASTSVALTAEERYSAYWALCLINVAIITTAARMLGAGSLRASLGRQPTIGHLALAVGVAAASYGISYAYVELLSAAAAEPTEPEELVWRAVLAFALLPALVEEWLCRGVLWTALRPIAGKSITIFGTAVLFAFLHGLNGGFILELPHRFVGGLLLGWLRARTGSLAPCVLAHFLHNGLAILA